MDSYIPGIDSFCDGNFEKSISVVGGGGGIAEAGGGGGGGAERRASASSGIESSGNSGKFCIDGAIPGPKSVI